jgi:hypothetical protein
MRCERISYPPIIYQHSAPWRITSSLEEGLRILVVDGTGSIKLEAVPLQMNMQTQTAWLL